MFPLAFVAGSLQGHWWGFISRKYVVRPILFLMNVFIALKGTQFWFLFTYWAFMRQIYRNSYGHMTKMAALATHEKKTFLKIFFFETESWNCWYHWILVYRIVHSCATKFVQMVSVCRRLTFSYKVQFWFPILLYGKMLKWWITQKLMESISTKMSTWRYMCTIGKGHFLPLSNPSVVRQHFQTSSPQKPQGQSMSNMHILLGIGERKCVQMMLVTWPRWPPCPYMVKNLLYLKTVLKSMTYQLVHIHIVN